jgi:hypothetical protein
MRLFGENDVDRVKSGNVASLRRRFPHRMRKSFDLGQSSTGARIWSTLEGLATQWHTNMQKQSVQRKADTGSTQSPPRWLASSHKGQSEERQREISGIAQRVATSSHSVVRIDKEREQLKTRKGKRNKSRAAAGRDPGGRRGFASDFVYA